MKGRPKKTRLAPKWNEARKRWVVTIPASWDGKRRSAFFESEGGAWAWIDDRERERANGQPVTVERHADERSISSLARMYLEDRRGRAGHRLLANHLGKLCVEFGGLPLSSLSPYAARKWVMGLDLAPRTRWGIYSSCRSFGQWATRYKFAPANPFDAMEPPPRGDAPKAILTPAQFRALLAPESSQWVNHYMRAWIVLGGLAGLRTAEILRMDWSCLNFEAKEIHVPPTAIKKTRGGMRERYVTMLPAFLACMIGPQPEGPIIPVAETTFHYHATRIAERVLSAKEWPHNCLRHSFASYHLAMWEDAGKTAHQMGHTSSQMVHQNYARAVRKADAVEWWAIGSTLP
jgi:integrase